MEHTETDVKKQTYKFHWAFVQLV